MTPSNESDDQGAVLSEVTSRRLGLIKYIWRRGEEACDAQEPLSSISVLLFHDAVELFLQLCSEHLDVGSQSPNFLDYWDRIGTTLEEGLSGKESMRRLNKARVALKHHGTSPSRVDIQSFRATVREFFDLNSRRVFGIDFERISLIALVNPKEARVLLEKAVNQVKDGELEDSLASSASAFHVILNDGKEAAKNQHGISPFEDRLDLRRFQFAGFGGDKGAHELSRFARTVAETIEEIKESIQMIAFGIDYHRYLRFMQATPHVRQSGDGTFHIVWARIAVKSPAITRELAQFCIDFVVDSSLRLANHNHVHSLFFETELTDKSPRV